MEFTTLKLHYFQLPITEYLDIHFNNTHLKKSVLWRTECRELNQTESKHMVLNTWNQTYLNYSKFK